MKKREKLDIIRKWYPQAITTIDCVNTLIDFVEEKLDLEPAQIMLADSICSDDVNSIQYPARANEFLGPFKLGGLDGFRSCLYLLRASYWSFERRYNW
jgi:hypothetical protein